MTHETTPATNKQTCGEQLQLSFFDRVSRLTASPLPRRQVLRHLGTMLFYAFIASIGMRKAQAVPICSAGLTCTNGVCCPAGCFGCNGTCCCIGLACISGACGACTAPSIICSSGACVDVTSDVNNCGACGTACGAGQICSMGMCCPNGTTNLDGVCFAPVTPGG